MGTEAFPTNLDPLFKITEYITVVERFGWPKINICVLKHALEKFNKE